MMEITLESLGLSQEEIIDRVVGRIADSLLGAWIGDGDDESIVQSKFAKILEKKVLERINLAVEEIAGRHVLPNVAAYVETLCLQETNKWGEKKGSQVTFVEYLVDRAEKWLREEVDYQGKTKDSDSFSWKASGTRVAYMIHEHLQYSIKTAMEQALKEANASIASGITDAVKIKLAEILTSLKVKAEIK
jgi:hypothetical protein